MRNKFSLLLGCLTLVLLGLFTSPVQAEVDSPTQVFVEQADFSFDQAVPSAVLLLDAPLPTLSPLFTLETIQGDIGSIATGNVDADWPPGSLTVQELQLDNLLRCGCQESYSYTTEQSNQNFCYNTALIGIDIDRSCLLSLDVIALFSGTQTPATRHVLMC